MPRLAFVLPDLAGGGAERVALTLMTDFAERGHEVDLVVARASGELLELLPKEVRLFDLKAARYRQMLLPLVRYLRQRRPNAVQASMWPLTGLTILAARLAGTGTRVIVSDHSVLSKQYRKWPWRLRALRMGARLLYPHAYARVCVSDEAADDLAALSGIPRGAFTIIRNPLFKAGSRKERVRTTEPRWPTAVNRILTVGNLAKVKNHDLLIRAFALLTRTCEASLMIVGEGELRLELEATAQNLGVSDRVVMPGFVVDPGPFYASADLFVLSSDYEGYALVLVEAMLVGLPIVSTDCGSGARDILDGGRFGTLTPVGDVEALAREIKQRLVRPISPERLKRRAEELLKGSVEAYREIMTADTGRKQTTRGSKFGRNSSLASF